MSELLYIKFIQQQTRTTNQTLISMNLKNAKSILDSLSSMSIKKIVVIACCIYPLFAGYYYMDEIKFLMSDNSEQVVKVTDVSSILQVAHSIESKYDAETVSVYVYQPYGQTKTWKERVCHTPATKQMPLMEKVELISQAKLLNDLNENEYIEIKRGDNNYRLSKLLHSFDVEYAYVIPLKNDYGLLIADVLVTFNRKLDESTIRDIANESEILKLSILESN